MKLPPKRKTLIRASESTPEHIVETVEIRMWVVPIRSDLPAELRKKFFKGCEFGAIKFVDIHKTIFEFLMGFVEGCLG